MVQKQQHPIIDSAAQRRQARPGEREHARAGRSLTRRPPRTGGRETVPRRNIAHPHHHHVKTRESMRAREHASGADRLTGAASGAASGATADRRHQHQRPSNQRQRPSCAARWCIEFLSRSVRALSHGGAASDLGSRSEPANAARFGKYLSRAPSHASATGPVNQRIWEAGNSGLVWVGVADELCA